MIDCGGSATCEHGRQKATCKDCGGSATCEHGRQKAHCKLCADCPHQKKTIDCADCYMAMKKKKQSDNMQTKKHYGSPEVTKILNKFRKFHRLQCSKSHKKSCFSFACHWNLRGLLRYRYFAGKSGISATNLGFRVM